VRRQPFWLDENLMRAFVREAMHLVLDRGAIARPDTFDDAGEHWRSIAARANDLVRTLVRCGDVADDLRRMFAASTEI